MSITATSLTHPNTQCAIAGALRKATKAKHGYTATVQGRKGPIMTIRYTNKDKVYKSGIITRFRAYKGNQDVTESMIKSLRI